jgi:DNA-directed RNA polymerase subunit H (RpoH/RPB5)
MLRKLVCAVAILGLSGGLAVAEEMRGKITKIEDGKVTFQIFDKETKKFGDAKTYEVAKDVKVNKMENDKKVLVDGGLKSSDLSKIDAEKGVRAAINVTDGRVTEITLSGNKRKDSN